MIGKIKKLFVLLLTVVLIFTVSGCGKREISDCPPIGTSAPLSIGNRIKLSCYRAGAEETECAVRNWVAAFGEKYPYCEVEIEFANLNWQEIQVRIASKSVGDVFSIRESDVYNYAVTQEILMPLDFYFFEYYGYVAEELIPAAYGMGRAEEKLYMVVSNYDRTALAYNKDAVAAAGLTDPTELEKNGEWTWETFRLYCELLTKKAEGGRQVDQLGGAMHFGKPQIYIPFLEGYGGSWYDFENGKITFLSEESEGEGFIERGMNEMVDTIRSGTVRYDPVYQEELDAPREVRTTPERNNYSDLDPVTDIVFRDMKYADFTAVAKGYEEADIDWGCVSFPQLPVHKVGATAEGYGVFNETRNPDTAAALCLFLYTEAGQRAYIGQENSIPVLEMLRDDDFWHAPVSDQGAEPVNVTYYDAWISYPEADTYGHLMCVLPPEIARIVETRMQNIVPDAINGVRSVRETLALIERDANMAWEILRS